jgi:hypothetical protein
MSDAIVRRQDGRPPHPARIVDAATPAGHSAGMSQVRRRLLGIGLPLAPAASTGTGQR